MELGNYKINMTTEAESKEAQELFFELGYMVVNNMDCEKGHIVASKNAESPINFDYWHDVKNIITIQQLRDLVVLHRNDVSDATHSDGERNGFLSSDGIEYFWNAYDLVWFKAKQMTFAYEKFKPIQEQVLISGADALRALADGREVEHKENPHMRWGDSSLIAAKLFLNTGYQFRLKPRTITLNIEIPAPFEPTEGEKAYRLAPAIPRGYTELYFDENENECQFGTWRTEEEIKKVVAALRGALKNG